MICLAGLCGRWVVYLWYGLVTRGSWRRVPTLMQRRLTVWSIRCGYIMALGQFLLGYVAGICPAWMVLGAAGLGAVFYVRLEYRLDLKDHDAAQQGR